MYEEKIVVQNKSGLHARPASQLVELSQQYRSDVTILTEEDEINAKSIISVLAGGVLPGREITLQVEGVDEAEAGGGPWSRFPASCRINAGAPASAPTETEESMELKSRQTYILRSLLDADREVTPPRSFWRSWGSPSGTFYYDVEKINDYLAQHGMGRLVISGARVRARDPRPGPPWTASSGATAAISFPSPSGGPWRSSTSSTAKPSPSAA